MAYQRASKPFCAKGPGKNILFPSSRRRLAIPPMQRKATPIAPDLHACQEQFARRERGRQDRTAHLSNNSFMATWTGPGARLPNRLKEGIESISGLSMEDVRVHYNSPNPARFQALAYTRGAEIHLGPGQEASLPHEAWHVVQQKQGRVPPASPLRQGPALNDDAALEAEADVMGPKAAGAKLGARGTVESGAPSSVLQRKISVNGDNHDPGAIANALKKVARIFPDLGDLIKALRLLIDDPKDFGAYDLTKEDHKQRLLILLSSTLLPPRGSDSGTRRSPVSEVKQIEEDFAAQDRDNADKVEYFDAERREQYRYEIAGGKLVRATPEQKPLSTAGAPSAAWLVTGSEPGQYGFDMTAVAGAAPLQQHFSNRPGVTLEQLSGEYIYVMNESKQIFAAPQQLGKIFHSSFLQGGDVAAAGSIRASNGEILTVSNLSGHYKPEVVYLYRFVKYLQVKGVNIEGILVIATLGAEGSKELFGPAFLAWAESHPLEKAS